MILRALALALSALALWPAAARAAEPAVLLRYGLFGWAGPSNGINLIAADVRARGARAVVVPWWLPAAGPYTGFAGHSFGAPVALAGANRAARRHPGCRVVAVTIDPTWNAPMPPAGRGVDALNVYQTSLHPLGHRRVAGAANVRVPGTHHTSIDDDVRVVRRAVAHLMTAARRCR